MNPIPECGSIGHERLSALADAVGLTNFSYSLVATEIVDDDAFNADGWTSGARRGLPIDFPPGDVMTEERAGPPAAPSLRSVLLPCFYHAFPKPARRLEGG